MLEAENRSQASARRRASHWGPPSAEDASAVNVVRGLPLSQNGHRRRGRTTRAERDPTGRTAPSFEADLDSGPHHGAEQERGLPGRNVASMPDYDVLSIERDGAVA